MPNGRRRKQTMVEKQIETREAFKEYIREKRAENLSEETLKTYTLHDNAFMNWDGMLAGLMPTSLVTIDQYLDWISDMQEDERKSDVTIASYCRSVRAFLYWLMDKGYMEDDKLKIPKYQAEVKVCYTEDELAALLEKPKQCTEVEYQTWVFINMICATGLRLSSAINLKVGDCVPKSRELYVQKTKSKKAILLYLNDDVLKIFNEYVRQFDLHDEDYVFCTAEGNRLARRTIQDNVASYNRARGVQKTSIHLFRHTYAKNYYLKTKDIYSLCQILGHSSIAVTENYLRDLGLSMDNSTAYNPQQQFSNGTGRAKRSRRGKMSK